MPRSRLIPLDWDRDAVAILSAIAPSDLDDAKIWWEFFAPTLYQAIMDAHFVELGDIPTDEEELKAWLRNYIDELEEEDLETESKKAWFAAGLLLVFAGGRYWRQNGVQVPWPDVRNALDVSLLGAKLNTQALCNQLRNGDISLASWQQQMAHDIKTTQVAATVAASGGADAVSPAALRLLTQRVNVQLDYLANFATAIAGGMSLDGTVCRLMKMYINGARGTFHAVESFLAVQSGWNEYYNILGATEDHCTGSGGCIEVEAAGWQPVGSLPEIGARNCMSNCLCSWKYRNSLTGEERVY